MTANNQMMADKTEMLNKQNEDKYLERMNFFPFTHGENIEMQRKEIGENQKQELNELFNKKQEAEMEIKQIKKQMARDNKAKFEKRLKMMQENEMMYE